MLSTRIWLIPIDLDLGHRKRLISTVTVEVTKALAQSMTFMSLCNCISVSLDHIILLYAVSNSQNYGWRYTCNLILYLHLL